VPPLRRPTGEPLRDAGAVSRLVDRAPVGTPSRRGIAAGLLVLDLVVLLAGVGALLDLRRLETPAGTARAWVQAAIAHDCPRLVDLARGGLAARRQALGSAEFCAVVETAYAGMAVSGPVLLGPVQPGPVQPGPVQPGPAAQPQRAAALPLTGRTTRLISLRLQRGGRRWRVVVDPLAGAALAAARPGTLPTG